MSDFDLREQAKNLLREIAGRELHQPDFFSDVAIADAEAFGRRCREEGRNDIKDKFTCDFDAVGDLSWRKGMQEALKVVEDNLEYARQRPEDAVPAFILALIAGKLRGRIEERSR